MPAITHSYTIGQEVFHVSPTVGVRDAIVRALAINITQTGTSISYDVAFKKVSQGSAIVAENTLYPDVDTALAAYKPTVIAV